MSIFTNPASGSPEQARAYVRAVLDLLGSRDPLAVLGETPAVLTALVDDLTTEEMAQAEGPGKWSIRQVLRHLADSELVWAYRLRMVFAQDRPQVTGYDQDAWADRLGYAHSDPFESLIDFTLLRRSNLNLLASASNADLERVGVHVERGEESIAHMIKLYAGHDLLHLRQIARIRGSTGSDMNAKEGASR